MSLQKLTTNYASYNHWANNRIMDCLGGLNSELLIQKTPSSFDTIAATVKHIYQAQHFWLDFITEKDISTFSWRMPEIETHIIMKLLQDKSAELQLEFSAFSEQELIKKLALNTRWAQSNLCRYEYMLHVINHSTYHRGQIITMVRSMGITEGLVNTDYSKFLSLKDTVGI